MFKTDMGGDTSYENAPYELKNPLFRKQEGFHRSVLQQQTYLYAAAPRAAWKKKGDCKAFDTLLFSAEQDLHESYLRIAHNWNAFIIYLPFIRWQREV